MQLEERFVGERSPTRIEGLPPPSNVLMYSQHGTFIEHILCVL